MLPSTLADPNSVSPVMLASSSEKQPAVSTPKLENLTASSFYSSLSPLSRASSFSVIAGKEQGEKTFMNSKLSAFAGTFLMGAGAALILSNPVTLGLSMLVVGISIAVVGLAILGSGIYMEYKYGNGTRADVAYFALSAIAGGVAGFGLIYIAITGIAATATSKGLIAAAEIAEWVFIDSALLVGVGAIATKAFEPKPQDIEIQNWNPNESIRNY